MCTICNGQIRVTGTLSHQIFIICLKPLNFFRKLFWNIHLLVNYTNFLCCIELWFLDLTKCGVASLTVSPQNLAILRVYKHIAIKTEFEIKCIMNLRCLWHRLPMLYHVTSQQPRADTPHSNNEWRLTSLSSYLRLSHIYESQCVVLCIQTCLLLQQHDGLITERRRLNLIFYLFSILLKIIF